MLSVWGVHKSVSVSNSWVGAIAYIPTICYSLCLCQNMQCTMLAEDSVQTNPSYSELVQPLAE